MSDPDNDDAYFCLGTVCKKCKQPYDVTPIPKAAVASRISGEPGDKGQPGWFMTMCPSCGYPDEIPVDDLKKYKVSAGQEFEELGGALEIIDV